MLALEPIGTVIFGVVGDVFGCSRRLDLPPLISPRSSSSPTASARRWASSPRRPARSCCLILQQVGPALITAAQGGAPLQAMFAEILPHLQGIGTAVLGLLPILLSFGSTILPLIMGMVTAIIPLDRTGGRHDPPGRDRRREGLLLSSLGSPVFPPAADSPWSSPACRCLSRHHPRPAPPIMSIVNTIIDILGPAISFLALAIVELVFSNLVTIIGGAIGVITGVLTAVAALLRGDFAGAWEAL